MHAQQRLMFDIQEAGLVHRWVELVKELLTERKLDLSYTINRQHSETRVTVWWSLNSDGSSQRAVCNPDYADETFVTDFYKDGTERETR